MENKLDDLSKSDIENPPNWWIGAGVLITLTAAFWRFYHLTLKPLHHDEGVNGYFLVTLFREGTYKYDPTNYHGPTLYYISLAFTKLFGLETFWIRASVGIFGVLMVLMVLYLRRYIGNVGSLCAALFLALSPGMVYISRYFIHEIFFVFCSLGIVLGVLFFIEGRKPKPIAIAAFTLLLLVCFLPSVMNIGNIVGDDNATLLWILRIGVFAIEAFLVFLLMRMILSWDEGRPIYLMLASASLALFFATKETAFITLGTMIIAFFCIWVWRKIYPGVFGEIKENELEPININWKKFRESLKASSNSEFFTVVTGTGATMIFLTWLGLRIILSLLFALDVHGSFAWAWRTLVLSKFDYGILLLCFTLVVFSLGTYKTRQPEKTSIDLVALTAATLGVFIYVSVLFFSSFFTNWNGVSGAFEAYAFWTKTGTGDHTQNGTLAYLKWLTKIESPILVLSAVGTLIAFLKGRHIFAMFLGLWAFGLFAAYTIIPYKTPWLALSFVLPMCLAAGYGINEIAKQKDAAMKAFAGLLAIVATGILGYQTYDLNFLRYDNDEMPYVYAHTKRGFLDLINKIEYYAKKSGRGKEATIEIVSPEYWSMPWYMREFPHANFQGRIVDANTAEMIVAKKDDQEADIEIKYSAHYKIAGEYPLRPGVDLILLVRSNLADPDAKPIVMELLDMPVVEVER